MNIISKNIIRFYSTPTLHRNLKKNIKKNILSRDLENQNKDNTEKKFKYNNYNSYKNMYKCLPIKVSNN